MGRAQGDEQSISELNRVKASGEKRYRSEWSKEIGSKVLNMVA